MDKERIKVLLVEDDEDDYVIVKDVLSAIRNVGFDLDWANGYTEAVTLSKGKHHDVCLMDYRLGGRTGIELMQEFNRNGYETPIIILTGQGDYDIDVQAMKHGAYDYLEKERLDPALLGRSIRYAIEHFRMLKALKGSEQKLRALSARILEAQENERKLIAQELHDSIGAALTAVKYALEQKMIRGEESSHQNDGMPLQQIIAMVRGTIEETRSISSNLRPSVLDDLGILAAIRSLCREFQGVYKQIKIEHVIDIPDDALPDPIKIVIYRMVQEALNNVSKHSGADKVQICLAKAPDGIELIIRDNGRGFDPQAIRYDERQKAGMGLQGMKERAELSDGSFELSSRQGGGTTIRAVWPR